MARMPKKAESNLANSPLGKFIDAGKSEIEYKGKSEIKGSLALAYAVLASDDVDVRSDWRSKVVDFDHHDEEVRNGARDRFAEYIGAIDKLDTSSDKPRKTQDYRNLMLRQFKRMQFALDLIDAGWRAHVVINDSGRNVTASIVGGSELASHVWTALDWSKRKSLTDKRSPMNEILLAQRASTTQQGEISWSKLAEIVAAKMNRKKAPNAKAVTITASKPVTALQAVNKIVSDNPAKTAVHFSTVGSKVEALDTAESILQYGFNTEDMQSPSWKRWTKIVELIDAQREEMKASLARVRGEEDKAAA